MSISIKAAKADELAIRAIRTKRRKLTGLKLSTALVSTFVAGNLHAQSLPSGYSIPVGNVLTNPTITVSDADAVLPTIPVLPLTTAPGSYENMAVELHRATTVIDWTTFNITNSTDGNASKLDFSSTVGAASVLNRVSAGNPSTIQGQINAPGIDVWLVNTSGITVGAGGSFNGASLVLSASDIAPADFGNASMALTGVDTPADIVLTGAGAISATNSIVVVGQKITANKAMTATNDIALIAARDLNLPTSLGSPLSITITKGTNLTDAGINVGGALTGKGVRIVGASEGSVINSLLNVNAGGTLKASGADGVIVLATASDAATGVSIAGAAAENGITVADTLTATDANGDIAIRGTGAVSLTAAATATRDIDISGKSVTVNTGAIRLKSAEAKAGNLSLSATTGDVEVDTASATDGTLAINAVGSVTGRAGGRANLAATGVTPQNIVVTAGAATALDTVMANGAISITAGLIDALTVNAGTALALDQRVGSLTFPGGGAYVWGSDLSLKAADDVILPAALTSPGAVALNAGRDVLGPSVSALAGNVSITAGRDIGSAGATRMAVSAGGIGSTATLTGSTGTARLAQVSADGATSVTNASVDISAPTIILTSATSTAGALSLNATAGDVRIDNASATGGNLTIAATGDLRGRAVGGRAALVALGSGSNIVATIDGTAFLGTPDGFAGVSIKANAIDMTGAIARTDDAVTDSATTAALGDVTAAKSIAARAGTSMTAGTLTAGEDIALRAGTTITLNQAGAGDDIDLNAGGLITATTLTTTGLGIDLRAADLTGGTIVFGAETASHAKANVYARSTAGGLALGSVSTNGANGGDIALDAVTPITVDTLNARGSAAILARAGTVSTTGNVQAGEDLAIQATGAVSFGGTATAGDDLDITGSDVQLASLGQTTGTGGAVDARTVSFAGPAIAFAAGEVPTRTGADINIAATTGDVRAQTLATADDVTATAAQNVRVDTITATTGNAALIATAGDVTGRVAATPGATDPAFGRANVAATGATKNVSVTAGGLAQIGTGVAGNALTVLAGTAVGPRNGAIDIATATTTNGALTLTARAVAPVAGTVYDGDIILGVGSSGGAATLSNSSTGGTRGDIIIANRLTAVGNIALQSANDVRITEFTSGPEGAVRSTGGNILVTAVRSVYGLAGGAAIPADFGYGSVAASGNLTVNGTGDGRIDNLVAGNNLQLNIAGSLTGRAVGSSTAVTGGSLFANGTIQVDAGNNAGDVARFNTLVAGGNIALDANGIAVGSATSNTGTLTTTGLAPGNFYFGALSVAGDFTINLGGGAVAPALTTSTLLFDPIFRSANLTATNGAITTVGTIGGIAQLGTVSGRTGVALAAAGLAANTISSAAGGLLLRATQGTLAVGTGTAATTATLIKQNGAIATPGDEIRVTTSLTAGGDASVQSNTYARLASVTSTTGNVDVTATLGDVSGTAITPAAADGRMLASFGRGTLTATSANKSVTVNAGAGTVQMGMLSGGTGSIAVASDLVKVTARAIDLTTAQAVNGNLSLTATAGDVVLNAGSSGRNSTLLASSNIRVGDLTVLGNISVTATTGDITGLRIDPTVPVVASKLVSTDATLSPSYRAANLSGVSSNTTIMANAGNVAQFGQLITVGSSTPLVGDQITVVAKAISVNSATASRGNLVLTATQGTLSLGAGSAQGNAVLTKQAGAAATDGDELRIVTGLTAGGNATVTSSTHVRAAPVNATGNANVTATAGDVTGIAISGPPHVPLSGALVSTTAVLSPLFSAANISAGGLGSATVGAGNIAQIGTLTAGRDSSVTAKALTVTTNTVGSTLSLLATQGTLALGTGTAGTTATLTKQNGNILTPGDEMRVTTSLTAGGNATLLSNTHVRAAAVTSTGNNIAVTATLGDVSGLAVTPAATDGRLLTNFGRGTLTSTASPIAGAQTISVNAVAGMIQMGNVAAGSGFGTTPLVDQVKATSRAIDMSSANAVNGNLLLTATAGDVNLATGNSGVNAILLASNSIRLGNLTARTGNISATATIGDITGLRLNPTVPIVASKLVSTDAILSSSFGAANMTASAANAIITATAGNVAQFGTLNAGTGSTSLVADQIIVNAKALTVGTARVFNGNLTLTATQGTLVLSTDGNQGTLQGNVTLTKQAGDSSVDGDELRLATSLTANGNVTLLSSTYVRAASITSNNNNVNVTATLGDVTGLARFAVPHAPLSGSIVSLTPILSTAFNAINLIANGGSITVGAGNIAQIGTLKAGLDGTVTAKGLTVDNPSVSRALTLRATQGTLAIASGDAGGTSGTVTLIKQNGAITTPGDEIRVTSGLFAMGDISIQSDTSARLFQVSSTIGKLDVTAPFGDVSGGTLMAGSVDRALTVSARTVNVSNAGAANGNILLTATAGDVTLGLGTSALNTTLLASNNVRVGNVTARAGNIGVTATAGDVTGPQTVPGAPIAATRLVSTDAILSPSFGASILTALAANRTITVGAAGVAQLGALNAGSGTTLLAVDQIVVNAKAISVDTARTSNGNLVLNASQGTLALNSGFVVVRNNAVLTKQAGSLTVDGDELRIVNGLSANGNVTVTSSTHVRASPIGATGDISVTATSGDVTGVALSPAPHTPLSGVLTTTTPIVSPVYGGTVITANTGSATVAAGNVAQVNSIAAGLDTKVTAKALTVTSDTAGRALALAASQGTLALGTGTAGTTATLTKQNGSISTLGDEVRVTTSLTAGGNATVLSNTHVRAATITSSSGNASVTATLGDVTGLALTGTPLSGAIVSTTPVLSPGFGGTTLAATLGSASIGTGNVAQVTTIAAGLDTSVTAKALTVGTDIAGRALALTASQGTLTLGTGVAGTTATLIKQGGSIATSGDDLRVTTALVAGGNATLSSNTSARLATVSSITGNLDVTATLGDVTGLALGAVPYPASLQFVPLNTAFGAAQLAANGTSGSLSVTAAQGVAQLGTITAGQNVSVTAKALSAITATAAAGTLSLAASAGSLLLGTGTAGADAVLTKTGDLAGLADVVDVTTLLAGARDGGTGSATISSATDIRVDTVTAKGGSITLTAADGEVTGRAGARAQLTAALATDAGGAVIAGSDRSITVTSGRLALLGTVTAGDNIDIAAGSASGTGRNGAIDVVAVNAARGYADLKIFNDDPVAANGIAFDTVDAGTFASFGTLGSNGGSIVGTRVDAGTDVVFDAVRNIQVTTATAGLSIAARAGGAITSTSYVAGEDISATAIGALALDSATAGDDVDLTGSTLALRTAMASGAGPDTSAVDFSLSPVPFTATERTDRANANIILRSTVGALNVDGDLSAQRNISAIAATDASLKGQVTAGFPVGTNIIGGDYSVTTGGIANLGNAGAAVTQKASGAVTITGGTGVANASLPATLTLQSNNDGVGAERLSVTATSGAIALGATRLIGGTLTGRESEIRLTANGGAVSFDTADGNGLAVRAGGKVTATGTITAGNASRAADPVGTFNTVDIATTAGDMQLVRVDAIGAGHDILLTTPGALTAITLTAARNLTATGGSIAVTNALANATATATAGALAMTATNGTLTLDRGVAGTTASLRTTGGNGDVVLNTSLQSGQGATISSVRNARLASVSAATGNVTVTASTGQVTGIDAGAANLVATTGQVSVTGGTLARLGTVGAATSTGVDVTADTVVIANANAGTGALSVIARAGSADITTGRAGTSALVTATTTANVGSLTTGTTATVRAASVGVTTVVAGGALLLDATNGAAILTTGSAGGTGTVQATGAATIATALNSVGKATVTAGTTLTAGTVASSGADVALTGNAVNATLVNAATTLNALARAGDLTIGTGNAGGAVTLTASGTARLGAITATGRPITLTASDAVLNGNITGSDIMVINRSTATNPMRLGSVATATGAFSLDQAEVNRLNAPAVTLDAGTATGLTRQDVQIGALALDTDTGSTRFDVLALNRIDATGTISADGSAATRTIRFGGSAIATDKAAILRVAATADGGGGRIVMPTANLDLRAIKIGVGQDQAFLGSIGLTAGATPLDSALVNTQFVTNPNSTLYSAGIGGTAYLPSDQILVSARTLTVRFTDYALFQNTGSAGLSRGIVLGGSVAAPITDVPVLTITGPNPPDARGFAAYGSINGITESGAALLGANTLRVVAVDPANARINGCVIGSGGGGCLANTIAQPVLNVFDSSRADVFKTAADFEIPFDPVIGTNNESLFGDVGTFGLEDIPLAPLPECDASKDPKCSPAQDQGK